MMFTLYANWISVSQSSQLLSTKDIYSITTHYSVKPYKYTWANYDLDKVLAYINGNIIYLSKCQVYIFVCQVWQPKVLFV